MSMPHDIDPRDARIAQLEARNAELADRNAELDTRNVELDARNAELAAENARLQERIEQLEHFLGLDSTTSSKPPSTDSEHARQKRQKTKKRSRKLKPGAQPGHPGTTRELLPEDQVDTFHHHYPTHCDCGLELAPADVVGEPVRHQQFELVPKLVDCTEHRLHACQCPGCGAVKRASLPSHQRLGWGPRLTALLATLSVTLHATRGKLDWFITHVLGAPSSRGSVQKYLEEASDALALAHEQARRSVLASPYVGCDETGWRLGRLPYWIWLAQSVAAVFVLIRSSRGKECAREALGEAQARVITTDRYSSYYWIEPTRNQVCRAHLLRDWKEMARLQGTLGAHGKRLVKLEKGLHKLWRRWRAGELERERFLKGAQAIREKMEKECVKADGCRGAPAVVRWVVSDKHRERGWVFLTDEQVELTNNQSERDVRTCVIQRKLSFGSKSQAGLRLMERLWTVALTCQRQQRSVLEFITQAMLAHRLGGQPPRLV